MNVRSLLNNDQHRAEFAITDFTNTIITPHYASINALLNHDQAPPPPPPTRQSTLGKRPPMSPVSPVKRPRFFHQLPDIPLTPLPRGAHHLLCPPSPTGTTSVCSSIDIHSYNNVDDVSSCSTVVPHNDLDLGHSSPNARVPQQPARRLAQSRIVGHRYRANEKIRSLTLLDDVERLQEENDMLAKQLGQLRIGGHQHSSNCNSTTRFALSSVSAYILDAEHVTGATALILLCTIAARRNLFGPPTAQPQPVLECPTLATTDSIIRNGSQMICVEAMREHRYGVKALLWEAQVWSVVGRLHARWTRFEMDTVTLEERPHFEKRCTRCGKVRTAGNGHPRSECDDGRKVGSLIPYQDPNLVC